LAAATELQVVSLADALALCLLVRDREPAKFTRLALRWHARFYAETPVVDLETGRLVLDLLTAIGGADAVPVARALRELIGSYDVSLAEPLRRWESEQAANRSARRSIRRPGFATRAARSSVRPVGFAAR
jgi:hypothetical protein